MEVRAMGARCVMALAVSMLVAACVETPASFDPEPLDYRDRTPVNFAVEEVSITSIYQAPMTAPFVDHSIQPTPEAAARALLQQRLHAAGGIGKLQAVITDASVIAIDLATRDGLSGYLTTEAETRLEGRLKVRLDYLDVIGDVVSSATTTVTRTRAIQEDAGYVERQQIGHELVRALVDDLDSGVLSNLQGSFADIVVP
jgi:hypothetical protein